MEALLIIFYVLIAISLLCLGGMWLVASEKIQSISLYAMAVWAIVIAYMCYTSYPDNAVAGKIFSLVIGLAAVISIAVKIAVKSDAGFTVSRICASISCLTGLWYLFVI